LQLFERTAGGFIFLQKPMLPRTRIL
jgi:hypothetical protein